MDSGSLLVPGQHREQLGYGWAWPYSKEYETCEAYRYHHHADAVVFVVTLVSFFDRQAGLVQKRYSSSKNSEFTCS